MWECLGAVAAFRVGHLKAWSQSWFCQTPVAAYWGPGDIPGGTQLALGKALLSPGSLCNMP